MERMDMWVAASDPGHRDTSSGRRRCGGCAWTRPVATSNGRPPRLAEQILES